MRRTAAVVVCLLLAGTVVGCSSGEEPEKETVTVTATPTPSPTPSLSQAQIKIQCSAAVAEAAPGWEDWNYDPGGWQDDPQTPAVCLGLADAANPASGNLAYGDALLDGLRMADDPRARQ
ncbi:hypothetical protein ACIA6D_23480 [Streptomyces cacaoi]